MLVSIRLHGHSEPLEYMGCGVCEFRGWLLVISQTGDRFEIVAQHRKADVQQFNSTG